MGLAVCLGLTRADAAAPTALEALWRSVAGRRAATAGSVLALVLATSTTNAFIAGASRLGDRLVFARRPEAPVPRAVITFIGLYAGVGMVAVVALAHASLAVPLHGTSGLFVLTYLLCGLSGLRVLPRRQLWMPSVVIAATALLLASLLV